MTASLRRILITGANGFVGPYLAQHLHRLGGAELWGTSRDSHSGNWPLNIRRVSADFRDLEQTRAMLASVRPDEIYHLAGQASVAQSWKQPADTYTTNVHGQLHLLEALVQLRLRPRILIVCSSDEYGAVEATELPVRETNALRPLSPYAISKVAQDLMGYQYYRFSNLPIIRTRAFNHTGPGRPDSYAISGFASQIARVEAGLQPPILQVGNLSIRREYMDVRDIVQAYALGMAQGIPGEVYNICSGRPVSLQEAVDYLLKQSSVRITISPDPERMRPADFPVIYGDGSAFHRLTGWTPSIPFHQTLSDLLSYWRAHGSKATPRPISQPAVPGAQPR